jgi:hypothetical protein
MARGSSNTSGLASWSWWAARRRATRRAVREGVSSCMGDLRGSCAFGHPLECFGEVGFEVFALDYGVEEAVLKEEF